jgi:hypothetical protein
LTTLTLREVFSKLAFLILRNILGFFCGIRLILSTIRV